MFLTQICWATPVTLIISELIMLVAIWRIDKYACQVMRFVHDRQERVLNSDVISCIVPSGKQAKIENKMTKLTEIIQTHLLLHLLGLSIATSENYVLASGHGIVGTMSPRLYQLPILYKPLPPFPQC